MPDARPLRVVHVCGTRDGAYWLVQIARGLRDRGWDVTAVIGGAGGSTARNLDAAGIPWVADAHMQPARLTRLLGRMLRGRGTFALATLASVIPLARTLRRLDADIVHSYVVTSIVPTRIASLLARVPIRVSMATAPPDATPLRKWDLATVRLDDRVISGSGRSAELYRELGVPAGKIADIHFGAEPALFDRGREDTAAVRAELGVGADTPLVGNVAYFYGAGVKGQEHFVDAARIVHEARQDVRFVLVGDGWGAEGRAQYARVQQQVRDLGLDGVVLFAGRRPRVADLLAALDVSAQCPLSDNYGGTLESLLMETPTIATDVGPMSEVLRHEETGLLVPPADAEALAAAILRLLEDRELAARLARSGRQLVVDEFDMEQTIDRIDALYRELARAAGRVT